MNPLTNQYILDTILILLRKKEKYIRWNYYEAYNIISLSYTFR